MKVNQAYRFALNPTADQERLLRSHAGAARFAWNWGLAKCQERYEAEGRWYSAVDLHKLWNTQKKADPALAWWGENSKCAYHEAFRDLERALRDFAKSKLAASGAERINACGGTARPGAAGRIPAKQEPGTAFAGETGTASGQPLVAVQELSRYH